MNVSEVRLRGCRPTPLGAYLKALGVLRIVGEQSDPEARGWWSGDTFMLASKLDDDALCAFFVNDYRPTPIVAPWNGGSGFTEKSAKTAKTAAISALRTIEASTDARLEPYRQAISVARSVHAEVVACGHDKHRELELCRAALPEPAVEWLDAAVVLVDDGESYPPLLGTGGNDGNFDFSKAFLDRVADVLGIRQGRGAPDRRHSDAWCREALLGSGSSSLVEEAIGQFDPGAAGGANSSPAGAAKSLLNPWDWVLLIEGALVFGAAAARRLGTDSGRAAIPFTFNATSVGFGTAADEKSRGELWAPLWRRPSTASEIAHLVGEGRADWRGGQARSAVDAARAVASLGTDRGIDCFVRHGLLERNGRSTAAVVLGRQRPTGDAGVSVTAQLDAWLEAVRRGRDAPATVGAGLRAVDRALYEHAIRPTASALQDVLMATANLEANVGRATTFRKKNGIRPISKLIAKEWMLHLDDGTPEVDVARALTSQRDDDGACLRLLLRPIADVDGRLVWTETAPVPGLGMLPLVDVLARSLQQRAVDRATRSRPAEKPQVGVAIAFDNAVVARASSLHAWWGGPFDEQRLDGLVRGFLLLDWRARVEITRREHPEAGPLPPPAVVLLAPFFARQPIRFGESLVELLADASWPALLAAGRVEVVVEDATRRLRNARLRPRIASPGVVGRAGPTGIELAAACMLPIDRAAAARWLQLSVRATQSTFSR